MPGSAGTMFGSWRNGWQREIWQTAVPRRLWSLSYRPHSFSRSRRRLKQTPKLSARCALPSPQHRSVIIGRSAFLIWRDIIFFSALNTSLFFFLSDFKSVDLVHPSDWIWRASDNQLHRNHESELLNCGLWCFYSKLSQAINFLLIFFIFQTLLKDRVESSTLMMDAKKIFSVMLPFTSSAVALETIQIPASLNLSFLTRI